MKLKSEHEQTVSYLEVMIEAHERFIDYLEDEMSAYAKDEPEWKDMASKLLISMELLDEMNEEIKALTEEDN